MSSVSPSRETGITSYSARDMSKIDDEIRAEAKKTRERSEEQLKLIEDNYHRALEEKEKDIDTAVRTVREASSRAITNEKEKYDAELHRMKEDNYNNRGISNDGKDNKETALGAYYFKSLDDLKVQKVAERKRMEEAHEDELNRLNDAHREEILQKDRDSNEAVKYIKKSANEAVTNERVQYQAELDKVKSNLYNNRGQVGTTVPYEVYKKEILDLQEASQRRHEKDMKDTEDLEDATHSRIAEISRKADDRIINLTEVQKEETRTLEDQVRTLNDFNAQAAKKQAEAVAQQTREYENAIRSENRRLNDAFNTNVDKLHQQVTEKDAFWRHKNQENLANKEHYFTGVIQEKELENYNNTKDLQKKFAFQIDQSDKSKRHDIQKQEEKLENLLKNANEQRAVALENQAKANSETLAREKTSSNDTIESLQKALQKQKTAQGTESISPSAEATVRNSITRQYDKILKTEVEKNKVANDHLQRKYTEQYKQALEQYNDKETQHLQENAAERAFERAQYLDSIQETDYQAGAKIREQDTANNQERESLMRQFGNLMERQRKDSDHIFTTARADAEAKLMSARQEASINSRIAQRTSNTRQNELIREYEKRLADQKTDFEFRIEDLQAQSRLDMREAERRSKQEIEAIQKGFELRVAQMDAQTKERERYVAQNYKEELDRTKRSYELLSKKKS